MTKHEENPILYAPKEGVDYVTCWNCRNGWPLCSANHDSLATDAVWCGKYDELIDYPYDYIANEDAECWESL